MDETPAAPIPSNKWWDKNVDPDIVHAVINFKLKLNNKDVYRDWRADAEINYDTLEDDLETCPSIYAFWSAVLAEARKNQRVVEYQIDVMRARILERISKDIKDGMKLTKDDKDNIINVDREYAVLKVKEIELENTVSKLFGIVDSLKMKADNLRSLAGFKRQEMSGS